MPFTDSSFQKSRSFWFTHILQIITTAPEKGSRNVLALKTSTLRAGNRTTHEKPANMNLEMKIRVFLEI